VLFSADSKVSIQDIRGPLLDMIDIHLEVPSVPYKELSAATDAAFSAEILQSVMKARDI